MTKPELVILRARLIATLKINLLPAQRMKLQADLSNVNASLKRIHIAEAVQQKQIADAKKADGIAELHANLARSAQPPAPHAMTPGERILMHAKRAAQAIGKIQLKYRLPHTITFLPALEAFVEAQKQHCRECNVPLLPVPIEDAKPVAEPEAWKQTWGG